MSFILSKLVSFNIPLYFAIEEPHFRPYYSGSRQGQPKPIYKCCSVCRYILMICLNRTYHMLRAERGGQSVFDWQPKGTLSCVGESNTNTLVLVGADTISASAQTLTDWQLRASSRTLFESFGAVALPGKYVIGTNQLNIVVTEWN